MCSIDVRCFRLRRTSRFLKIIQSLLCEIHQNRFPVFRDLIVSTSALWFNATNYRLVGFWGMAEREFRANRANWSSSNKTVGLNPCCRWIIDRLPSKRSQSFRTSIAINLYIHTRTIKCLPREVWTAMERELWVS